MRALALGLLALLLVAGCVKPAAPAPTSTPPGTATPVPTPTPTPNATTPTPTTPTPTPTPPSNGTPGNPQPPGVFSTAGGAELANVTLAPADSPAPGATKDVPFTVPEGTARLVVQVRIEKGPVFAAAQSTLEVLDPTRSLAASASTADATPRDYQLAARAGTWVLRFGGATSNTVHVVVYGMPS